MIKKFALILFVLGTLFFTSAVSMVFADSDKSCGADRGYERVEVSGTAVHYFDTKIVHRSKQTPTGLRETTTETIDLSGDLEGRVLYQPTGVYDFVNGQLVNTGRQVFSGTVLGSRPVLIYDDEFRFEVDLNTGAVHGEVYLDQHIAGPRTTCEITVRGSTPPVDGKGESTYTGVCWIRKGK